MNYLLLVYREEAQGEMEHGAMEDCGGLAERLHHSGHYVAGGILQPVSTATSVQVRQGSRMITDGPFAETREQLAGYMLIEARDLDEAIDIAAQHPVAAVGTLEIRPLREIPSFGGPT